MHIRTKLILVYGTLAVICSTIFTIGGAMWMTHDARATRDRLRDLVRGNLEQVMRDQAYDIAGQLEAYLKVHPLDSNDPVLRRIAVQKIEHTGYSGVHDGVGHPDGHYLFHKDPAVVGRALSACRGTMPGLWAAIRTNLTGREASAYYTWHESDGKLREKYFVGVPIKGTDCVLFVTIYVDDFYQSLEEARAALRRGFDTILKLFLGSTAAITLAMVLVSILVAQSVSRPLCRLVEHARRIGGGDLAARLTPGAHDEIGELAGALNKMSGDLAEHIEHLRKTTALNERMEGELRIARNIQQSILPHTFPPFPDVAEFDIHAAMLPAREVAGDFYDFFFIRPDRLAVVVGDVAGKGVPAAMFMAMSRALIRAYALDGCGPAAALTRVNRLLAANNDTCMFVTVIYAEYDLGTGDLTFCSAGHPPPVWLHGGRAELVVTRNGPILGPEEKSAYGEQVIRLAPGDELLLYTDGVTEAQPAGQELYGEERLQAVLARRIGAAPDALCSAVLDDVNRFVAGAEQFDDITLLALRANRLAARRT